MILGRYYGDSCQIHGWICGDNQEILERMLYPEPRDTRRVIAERRRWKLISATCTCFIAIVIAIARAMATAAGAMSLSSVAKRKHTQPAPASCQDSSPKRTRTSGVSDNLAVAALEAQVQALGAKVFAFRRKGLPFFARLIEERRVERTSEGATDTAPTESKNAQEDLRQVLKARLALANSTLPTLSEELVMWNTKIQQAVDVKRKDQRLPFLDDEENGS